MLAQEDTAATNETDPTAEVAVDTAAPQGVPPAILYPWLVGQLAAGFVGYYAYDNSVNSFIDLIVAIYVAFGATE